MVLLVLSGCASMNPLSVFTPKPQVNAQVGKENQQEVNTAKIESGTTNQKAEKISNDQNQQADKIVNIVKDLDTTTLIILVVLAGAALPSFREMYNAFKAVVGDVLNCFIVVPCKAIRDFILELKKPH